MGFVRIVSQPRYPNRLDIGEAARKLRDAVSTHYHLFVADDISLLDDTLVDGNNLSSPGQITDVYLLALAVAHGHQFRNSRQAPTTGHGQKGGGRVLARNLSFLSSIYVSTSTRAMLPPTSARRTKRRNAPPSNCPQTRKPRRPSPESSHLHPRNQATPLTPRPSARVSRQSPPQVPCLANNQSLLRFSFVESTRAHRVSSIAKTAEQQSF